jgi:hypothetical protein
MKHLKWETAFAAAKLREITGIGLTGRIDAEIDGAGRVTRPCGQA